MEQYRICPGVTFGFADNPVQVLNEHLSLLIGHLVLTKVICVHNNDKSLFDDQCRLAFDFKWGAHLWCTCDRSRVNSEEFVRC